MKQILLAFFFLPLFISCKKGDDAGPVPGSVSEVILKDYSVISIAFDPSGTAWLGTLNQGLIRYDGQTTTVFDSTNSILNRAPIWDIKIDKKRNVWIGTDELVRYDGSKFTRFESSAFNLPKNSVRAIGIDGSDHVWFASGSFGSGGLAKYDGNRFTTFTPQNSTLPGYLIASIAVDQENKIWAAVNDGVNTTSLVRISESKWEVFGPKEIGFNPYYFGNIVTNKQNELLASINYGLSSTVVAGRPQIFRFDGNAAKVLNLPDENAVVYMTQKIFLDRDNHLWASFSHGKEYGVLNNGKWELRDLDDSGGIFAFGQSPAGEIWVGSGAGVYILK